MSAAARRVEVVLCMGSSCFSRGNAQNLEAIRARLADLPVEIRVKGHLCEGRCTDGPHVSLDGCLHSRVTTASVRGLVEQHLAAREAGE